jgi:hypothetical protein
MIFDIEDTILRVETILKARLNTAIVALNTQKNDSIVLKQIGSDAYFIQSMDERMANYDPYVIVAIEDIQSEGLGPYTQHTLSILAAVCVSDQGHDVNISRRMFRYAAALREALELGWSDTGGNSQSFKLQSQVPISFQLLNTSQKFRAVGVTVTVGLA